MQNHKRNMKRSISYIFIALAGFFILSGCQHDTDTFDGPFLVDRFGEFSLQESLAASRATVDFSAGENVHFTAKFNKRVNYTLVITGQQSGAQKIFEGFDNQLNAENSTWGGGTTELPLFQAENCNVELIIPEADSLTMMTTVETLGTKSYQGSLFTDFETDPLDDIFQGNFEFEFTPNTGRQNDGMASEGNWYYFFEGTDDVVPNFFVGLVDMKSTITGETYAPVPTTAPEQLYFNAFMYADGGLHGIAVLQFIYDSNDSGAFEDGQDAAFQIEGDYPLNWVGWRHIYHTMADLGMTEDQVSKIVAIRALLISDMNSQPSPPLTVDYGLDFLIFTEGAPLEL